MDGETGLLAPIRDPEALAAAVRGSGDPALRARLVDVAARRVADFGIDRMARTLAIYGELAS